MTRYLKHVRPLAGALALIVGLTLVAPPAFAAPAPPVPSPTAPQPLVVAAAARVEAIPAATFAQAAQAPAAPSGEKPFFKTGKGVAAGVLIVAALVMTFVSYGNDRVKSPAK